MPRWPRGLHPSAGSGTPFLQPSRRPRVTPFEAFTYRLTQVPIGGGQATGMISAAGAATVQLGPQGIGTVWYPASVSVTTTTGPLDTSSCDIYVGPGAVLAAQSVIGTIYPAGRGVLAMALPPMPVGWYLTAVWTGGHDGDLATVNVIGSMEAFAA